jgi:hypothetical protein
LTFTIVGCGDSSQNWTPNGYSIGVNDAFKFGKQTDALVICNRPSTFSKDRLDIILSSKPKDFYSHKSNWSEYFPNWKKVRLHTWNGSLHDFRPSDGPTAYSSDTSPIIAITLAYNLGAKDIILWGVQFLDHHIFNTTNPNTKREVQAYAQVIACLKEKGVNVYLGTRPSALETYLEVYDERTVLQ